MSTSCEEYETYTVKVDSRGAAANNSFVGYIDIPLRNVVKAQILSASISSNTTTTPVLYVYINELVSKFNEKSAVQTAISVAGNTSNIGPNPSSTTSNISQLRTSLICFPAEQVNARSVFTVGGFWDSEVEFIEPIRQIQYLTVSIYKDDGNLVSLSGTTHLTIRFTCAKPNKCLY
jgi:hypothetical protein